VLHCWWLLTRLISHNNKKQFDACESKKTVWCNLWLISPR
jgi:hypothetical protein